MRILFTTVALPGHLFPLVPLAWSARAHGHEVVVATAENFVPAALRAGLPAVSCGPASGLDDLRGAGAVRLGGQSTLDEPLSAQRYAHGLAFAGMARRHLPGLRALVRSWRPDVVVSERAEFAGPLAAAELGVPRVELHWGAAPLTEYHAALDAQLASAGPADLVLNPWPPSLRQTYAATHHNMRYVPYNGEANLQDWMLAPAARPRICLTLGTVLPRLGEGGAARFLLPLLHRLAELDVEIVIAVDDEIAATWPTLPDAVRYAGRLPMAQVLAGCAASINHGGQGTSLTALVVGCPQLVLPQFDDQFDNADAVTKARAGVRLLPDETTADTVARACRELLVERDFAVAAAAAAAEIAAQPGATEIVERVTGLAG